MTLVEFLKARLNEDEQAAKAWLPFGNPDAAAREHIARHDPARVLAEVEAKRRILDEYEQATGQYATHSQVSAGEEIGLRFALKAIGLPYADHPDYDPAWRP